MFTNRSRNGKSLFFTFVLVVGLILPLVLGPATSSGLAAFLDDETYEGEPMTSFQVALADALSQRKAAGLSMPAVTFSAQLDGNQDVKSSRELQQQALLNKTTTLIATTTIYFSGPKEAGYDEWPAIEITGNLAGEDATSFSSGDITEVIRESITEQDPTFWQQVGFGHEARRYTITETQVQSPPSSSKLTGAEPQNFLLMEDSADILMGFTYTGPNIDYTVEESLTLCIPIPFLPDPCYEAFYIKAGVEFDWALGLRLPASVTLTGPDQVEQGSDYNFQTSLTPQDWVAAQYELYGVAPEYGNEFVLRFTFFAGVHLKIAGTDICPPGIVCYLELDLDKSTSFSTPFGEGSSFPIPSIEIPIYSLGVEGFLHFSSSLTITPQLTSTNIEADWQTVPGSDCSGSGTVSYTSPGVPVDLGPVKICNLDGDPSTNSAQVELSNFRYHFNVFTLALGVKVSVNLVGFYSDDFQKNFFTLDLSDIFSGLGFALGKHVQCDWDFHCSPAGPANQLILTIATTDTTPPVTTLTLPDVDGNNDWYRSDVLFSLPAADDCGSGVVKTEYSLDNLTWYDYATPVLLESDGIHTLYYRSTDAANNVEETRSQTIKIDQTPPTITGAPTSNANEFGWWNTDVVIHFEATDDNSGIASITPDVTISTEGAGQSTTGIAEDMAGNTAQVTVGDINIDKTPPVVTITSPLAGTYVNTSSFNIVWTASDALSGLYTEAGDMDDIAVTNGQLVELLLVSAGNHTVTVSATDKASNSTTESVDFLVDVDIEGLIDSVEYMCELSWIKEPGICRSLLGELYAARSAINRGQCFVAENVLNAFTNEVEAMRGLGLTEQAADVLTEDAQYIVNHLTCEG